MFRHVVCYRLKPEKKAMAKEAKVRLMSLQAIPEVRRVEVGLDIKKSERSFDFVLNMDFQDRDAYEIYDKHEVHQPVRTFMRSIVETSVSVDFETE